MIDAKANNGLWKFYQSPAAISKMYWLRFLKKALTICDFL